MAGLLRHPRRGTVPRTDGRSGREAGSCIRVRVKRIFGKHQNALNTAYYLPMHLAPQLYKTGPEASQATWGSDLRDYDLLEGFHMIAFSQTRE